MRLLDWLFGRKQLDIDPAPVHQGYAKLLDSEWDRYLKWRDSQVCVNCQAPFGTKDCWMTETQCADCYNKHGPGGKRRSDMLAETGNIYL